MTRITTPVLILLLLSVYRATLLVTGDRVTRAPRRAIRRWFRHRAHHLAASSTNERRCSCGWSVSHVRGTTGVGSVTATLIAQPVPKSVPMDAVELDMDWVLDKHIEQGRDASKVAYLLDCPFCVSVYLGLAGAAIVVVWTEASWWLLLPLALSASAAAGALAVLAAPDENDPED